MNNKLKNINRRLYTSTTVFVAVVVMVILFVWLFFANYFSPLQDEYSSNHEALAQLRERENLQEEIREDYEEKSEEAEKLLNTIPEEENLRIVIEALEQVASDTDNSYRLSSVQEIQGVDGSTTEQLNFEIELQGSFSNLIDFLREIRRLDELMHVGSMSIDTPGSGRTLQTNMSLQVYLR